MQSVGMCKDMQISMGKQTNKKNQNHKNHSTRKQARPNYFRELKKQINPIYLEISCLQDLQGGVMGFFMKNLIPFAKQILSTSPQISSRTEALFVSLALP